MSIFRFSSYLHIKLKNYSYITCKIVIYRHKYKLYFENTIELKIYILNFIKELKI